MKELFLRNLKKCYFNIENIFGFCKLAAFQFCVQPPPKLHTLLHYVTYY